MEQLLLHLCGDYITQTDWMARNKTRSSIAAGSHTVVYSIPFLWLSPSITAFLMILGTHFFIDRYRLARYVVYFKNWITQPSLEWRDSNETGYHRDTPVWLSTWLLIVADNTLYLVINYSCLKWL